MGALRDAAEQAYRDAQEAASAEARAALAGLLAPFDVSGLTADRSDGTWIFGDGDVYLGVYRVGDGWRAVLVRLVDGAWTRGEQVSSLAELGRLLPDLPPAPSVLDWAPQTVYAVGDHVLYQGVEYVCQQAHTSQTGWEPPAVPALWVRA